MSFCNCFLLQKVRQSRYFAHHNWLIFYNVWDLGYWLFLGRFVEVTKIIFVCFIRDVLTIVSVIIIFFDYLHRLVFLFINQHSRANLFLKSLAVPKSWFACLEFDNTAASGILGCISLWLFLFFLLTQSILILLKLWLRQLFVSKKSLIPHDLILVDLFLTFNLISIIKVLFQVYWKSLNFKSFIMVLILAFVEEAQNCSCGKVCRVRLLFIDAPTSGNFMWIYELTISCSHWSAKIGIGYACRDL